MKSLSKFSISLEHILLQRLSLNLIPESNSNWKKRKKRKTNVSTRFKNRMRDRSKDNKRSRIIAEWVPSVLYYQ